MVLSNFFTTFVKFRQLALCRKQLDSGQTDKFECKVGTKAIQRLFKFDFKFTFRNQRFRLCSVLLDLKEQVTAANYVVFNVVEAIRKDLVSCQVKRGSEHPP